jgi:hypothetical protein
MNEALKYAVATQARAARSADMTGHRQIRPALSNPVARAGRDVRVGVEMTQAKHATST